jgi:TatD DNase family protein
MATFYDTHAHLHYRDFAEELPEMMNRAEAAGISRIITLGTDFETSRRAIMLSERFPMLYAAVGWHPSDVLEAPEDVRPVLRDLGRHPRVVAIGETGMDYYRLPSTQEQGAVANDAHYKQRQAQLFEQQLEVAAELGLPCVVHQRSALEDTLAILQPWADRVRGQFHCFADDVPSLQRILGLGSVVSFTGILTYKNAQGVRDALAAAPLGQFMLETDSPYLAPMPHRGKRNEPAYVREIATVAAQVKGCTLDELSAATCRAAHEFFPKLG